jgi:hypothetical protein
LSLEHNLCSSGFTPLEHNLCSMDTTVCFIALTQEVVITDSEQCFTNLYLLISNDFFCRVSWLSFQCSFFLIILLYLEDAMWIAQGTWQSLWLLSNRDDILFKELILQWKGEYEVLYFCVITCLSTVTSTTNYQN